MKHLNIFYGFNNNINDSKMKIGYTIENFDANLDREYLVKTALIAEKAGFESLWTVDHIMQADEEGLTIYGDTTTAFYNNLA